MFHLAGGTIWDIYFSNAEGTEVKYMNDHVFLNCVAAFDLVLYFTHIAQYNEVPRFGHFSWNVQWNNIKKISKGYE